MTHGNLDFDFRRRCAVKVSLEDMEYDRIYYGLTAREYQPIFEDGGAVDLPSPYAELSRGGRRPGNNGRVDDGVNKRHFFNKSLRKVEGLLGDSDEDRVRARYGSIGPRGAQEAAPRERSAGSGGEATEQEEVTS